ncbi:hypothetical protein CHUAL_006372 [Chamberlinius hualienensis]
MNLQRYFVMVNLRRPLLIILSQINRQTQIAGTATKSADSAGAVVTTDEVIKKLRLNFEKTLKQSAKDKLTDSKTSNNYDPTHSTISKSRSYPKPVAEDLTVTNSIKKLLQQNQIEEAVKMFDKFAIDNRYPSMNLINKLAAICGNAGDDNSVNKIADVSGVAYPSETKFQMRFQHYVAEALWKQGKYKQSLELFYNLFEVNYKQRTKINNLAAFCMRHIVNQNLHQHFADVLDFVDRLVKLNDLNSAANLWRVTFCDPNHQTQQISEYLIKKYQPKILVLVQAKISAVINDATTSGNSEIFQRLLSTAIQFNLTESYSLIYGAYLEFLCELNDVQGVKECLKYVADYSIIIPAVTMAKSMALIGFKSNLSIGNPRSDPTPVVKFKF